VVRRLGLLCLLLLAVRAGATEAHLELPDSIPPDVTVTVKLIVSGGGGSLTAFHLPTVPGLLFSQQIIQHGVTIINGNRQDWVGIELRATSLGDYLIPAFAIDLEDGTSVQSTPAVLHVKAGDQRLKGVAVAEASFDPPTIVPGQPTKLIYRLSILHSVRPLDVSFGPPGDAVKLSTEPQQTTGTGIDDQGREWQVYTLTWNVTFTSPGEHVVDGEQQVAVEEDFFDQHRETVPVRPARLLVATIPDAGRPDDFTGVIGPLTLTAALAHQQITSDQGTVLSLTVSGPQAAQMHQPHWTAPAGLRAYPLDPVDEPGKRTFRWDLTPGTSGDYTIPSFNIPFFLPDSRTFTRATTSPLRLSVLPGTRVIPTAAPAAPGAATPAESPTMHLMPLRLHAWPAPEPAHLPWIFAIAALTGLLAGLAPRELRKLQAREHPGRDLARAIASHDLDAASRALARLRPRLTQPAQVQAAEELRRELDLARYGGRGLAPAALAWVSQLEHR